MSNRTLHVRGLFAIPPRRPSEISLFLQFMLPSFSLQCLPFIPRAQAHTAYTFSSSSSSSSSLLLYLSLPYLLPYLAHTGSWMEEATTTAEAALQQRKTGRGNTQHRNSKYKTGIVFYIIILCTMEASATGTENKSRRRSRPSYAAAGSIGSLGLILFFLYLMSLQQGMFSVQNFFFPESEL